MGGGDSGDNTLPTQCHLQGHLLATHLQSLTVLENGRGWVGKVLLNLHNVAKPSFCDLRGAMDISDADKSVD